VIRQAGGAEQGQKHGEAEVDEHRTWGRSSMEQEQAKESESSQRAEEQESR